MSMFKQYNATGVTTHTHTDRDTDWHRHTHRHTHTTHTHTHTHTHAHAHTHTHTNTHTQTHSQARATTLLLVEIVLTRVNKKNNKKNSNTSVVFKIVAGFNSSNISQCTETEGCWASQRNVKSFFLTEEMPVVRQGYCRSPEVVTVTAASEEEGGNKNDNWQNRQLVSRFGLAVRR